MTNNPACNNPVSMDASTDVTHGTKRLARVVLRQLVHPLFKSLIARAGNRDGKGSCEQIPALFLLKIVNGVDNR